MCSSRFVLPSYRSRVRDFQLARKVTSMMSSMKGCHRLPPTMNEVFVLPPFLVLLLPLPYSISDTVRGWDAIFYIEVVFSWFSFSFPFPPPSASFSVWHSFASKHSSLWLFSSYISVNSRCFSIIMMISCKGWSISLASIILILVDTIQFFLHKIYIDHMVGAKMLL